MRKTFLQYCAALLVAPVLTLALIGTISITASAAGGTARSGDSPTTSTPTVASITAAIPALTLTADETKDLPDATVEVTMSDNSKQTVTTGYTVTMVTGGDSSVATVNPNTYKVTGGKVSSTRTTSFTVTISYGGQTTTATCAVTVEAAPTPDVESITINPTGPLSREVGDAINIYANINPTGSAQTSAIKWEYDEDVLRISTVNGSSRLTALKPVEKTEVIAYLGDDYEHATKESSPLVVQINGFQLKSEYSDKKIELTENEQVKISDIIDYVGATTLAGLQIGTSDGYVASVRGDTLIGQSVGTTKLTIRVKNSTYSETLDVEVKPDEKSTITVKNPVKISDTLSFADLISDFRSQANGKLSYITGLNMDTSQGTLYYRYRSEAEPGIGVGSENYYIDPTSGQRDIRDITFVPKPTFNGGQVTIRYTAIAVGSGEVQNYACRIYLTVTQNSGSSGAVEGINLSTSYNTAVKFSSAEFNKVCRNFTGINLDYVTFSQPPERQGTLYTNYSSTDNYGSLVNLRTKYSLKELDSIWFVPAPGYTGPVTVYYTAHITGPSGESYTGQVIINVGKESGSSIGGLHYETAQGGTIRFDDTDFNDYCRDLLDNYQTVSFIRFDSLPAASEGVLYYDYTSTTSTGTLAALDTSYYYGTRTPRIDRLVFAAAEGYTGTVRIPFTGYTTDGTRFTGNVEINVRAGTGAGTGEIRYTCAAGRSVSFVASDFNSLCREKTNSGLDYIILQSLPNSTDGTLYHSSSRANTSTRYYRASGVARIGNLSFRASTGFIGAVDIPFVGYSVNGDRFDGVVTVESNSSGTSTNWGNIRYVTDSKTAAVFDRDDFDDLSQWETDRDVSTVRFNIPSTSQGSLYRGYRSSSSQGTRITSSNTSISASDLDRVAFVPASGFTGTVYLDFTATAASGGGTFTGTVEIEVERTAADVTVRYSTRTAPVDFVSSDFRRSGYTLSSIRLTSLPSTSAGYLYYQYTSPTRYGRQANTSTDYQTSGSNLISDLTFVPRAGYTDTVSIGYTGTNSNGSTFEGEVLITVSPSYNSSYFNDMSSYNNAQRAAVDFLRENGITNGISSNQYGPEHSITRGDFAVMVYQAFGLNGSGTSNAFYDVPSGVYYAQAVNTLYSLGIVSGIGNGAYAPQGTLSRQDAVCMVQRAMRASGWNAGDGYAGVLSSYSDASSVSSYAQGAMANAIQVGWLPTYSGRLDPKGALTRVDMAEMIHRVLTY